MPKFEFDPVKQRGSTERTRRLRAESMSTQPHIYIERAVLETEAYKMYEGTCSVPELRAKSLLHFFKNKKIEILKTKRFTQYPESYGFEEWWKHQNIAQQLRKTQII